MKKSGYILMIMIAIQFLSNCTSILGMIIYSRSIWLEKQEFYPSEKIKVWANWTIDGVDPNEDIIMKVCTEKNLPQSSIYNVTCPKDQGFNQFYTEIDFSNLSMNFTEYRQLWVSIFFIIEESYSSISKLILLKKNNSTMDLSIFNNTMYEYDSENIIQNTIYAMSDSSNLYDGNEVNIQIFNKQIYLSKTCKIISGLFQFKLERKELNDTGLYFITIQIPATNTFDSNIVNSTFQLQRKHVQLKEINNESNFYFDNKKVIFQILTQDLNGNQFVVADPSWNVSSSLHFEGLIDNGNGNYTFKFTNLKMEYSSEIVIALEKDKYSSNLLQIPIRFSKKNINLTIVHYEFFQEFLNLNLQSGIFIDKSLINTKQLIFQILSGNSWISIPINNTILLRDNFTIIMLISKLMQYNFTKNLYYECRVLYNEDGLYYSNSSIIYLINFCEYLSQFFKIQNITHSIENSKIKLQFSYEFGIIEKKIQKQVISAVVIKTNQFFNSSYEREIQQKLFLFNDTIILELSEYTITVENVILLRIEVFFYDLLNTNQYISIQLATTNTNEKSYYVITIIGFSFCYISLVIWKKKKNRCITMNLIDIEFN